MSKVMFVTTDSHIVAELRKRPAHVRNELLRSAATKADVRISGCQVFNNITKSFEVQARLPVDTQSAQERLEANFFSALKTSLSPRPGWATLR